MAASDSTPGKSPAFQFYPKEYLSDAKTRAMTFKQRGMYWDLVCYCWNENGLPADPSEIARILGITTVRRFVQSDWPILSRCFVLRRGRHQHPRLERIKVEQAEYRAEQSERGKHGAAARWGKDGGRKQPPSRTDAPAIDPPMANHGSPISDLRSPSPHSGEKSVTRGVGAGVMAGTLPRDHMNCHQPCIRVCLSEKQHAILRERHGGTDADLDAFYADVRSRLDPSVPIGDTPWKFWDTQFQARFGAAAVVNPRTAGNAAAAARFVARGQR